MKYLILSLFLLLPLTSNAVTYYGVNADITQVDNPPGKIPAREQHGGLRVAYDEFTPTANLTGLDTIIMQKLPKGAKVYDVILLSDELGAVAAQGGLSVGVTANGSGIQTANTQLFASNQEVGGADLEFRMSNDQTIAGNGTTLLAETQVVITPHQTTDSAVGKKIRLWVYYSTE